MFRKQQLELIIAALLPVCVLGIGFLVFSARAGLVAGESATPVGSGAYYRNPGSNNKWFGPEVHSETLCAGVNSQYNQGFDIIRTEENASVVASNTPHAVDWYRTQYWTFGSAPPWSNNSSTITLNQTIGWSDPGVGNGTNGHPWNGVEIHWRNGNIIEAQSRVTGWQRGPDNNWLCPKYYKTGGWLSGQPIKVQCPSTQLPFPPDWFDEPINVVLNPVHGIGQKSGSWYDCIALHQ